MHRLCRLSEAWPAADNHVIEVDGREVAPRDTVEP